MQFEITKDDQIKIDNWLKTIYPIIIEKQKQSGRFDNNQAAQWCWDDGYPYDGAIGGGLSYIFTPNSIGLVTKVRYREYELNLTNYDEW